MVHFQWVKTESQPNQYLTYLQSIFNRHLTERCRNHANDDKYLDFDINFELNPQLYSDQFIIEVSSNISRKIIGQNSRALLYGLGKFLRTSSFEQGIFVPSTWAGVSSPEVPLRAIYFATHFFNFYHNAPIAQIQNYIEDLALWGINSIFVWFDMHHFTGIKDPDAQLFIHRLHDILSVAKNLGLQIGITGLSNEAYNKSPKHLRADQTFPGIRHIRGGYGVELCPHKDGAAELIIQSFTEEFHAFADLNLDFFMIWPYDQGGCGCINCRPWGSNGFLFIAEKLATVARKIFPNIKIILSTWLFDPGVNEGEWEGLSAKLQTKTDWVDFILADSHTTYPEYPLIHGTPKHIPLLNFPEISMWNMGPWGGFGANPLPKRFFSIWKTIESYISGGIPYSEGIYEDMNKILWLQWYWTKNRTSEEILQEYIHYEYPGANSIEILEAIYILEKNHRDFTLRRKHQKNRPDGSAQDALERLNRSNAQIIPQVAQSWRWRILYLRAQLDFERFHAKKIPNMQMKSAFDELTRIYYAKNAVGWLKPPQLRFYTWTSKILRLFHKKEK